MKNSTFLLALSLLTASSASAFDFEAQNADGVTIYCNIEPDNTSVTVTYKDDSYNSYSGTVVIPEYISYNGFDYRVIAIGDNAFDSCDLLTNLVLPPSVELIGHESFAYCNALSYLAIPDGVYAIGNRAFKKCIGLQWIKVGAEDPAAISLGEDVFSASSVGIATLYVPDGSTSAFAKTAQWSEFDSVEAGSFDFLSANADNQTIYYKVNPDGYSLSVTCKYPSCPSYAGDISIPASVARGSLDCPVTAIGESAFYSCKELTGVSIPEGVTFIDEYAFNSCETLTRIDLPQSLTAFADQAFSYCSALEEIILPDGLESVGIGAFNYCTALAHVAIPASVTTIADNAFSYCKSLGDIVIPASVTSLGSYAFQFCSALQSVTAMNPDPANVVLGYNVFYYTPVADCTLHVPAGAKALYDEAPQWMDFGTIAELSTPGDVNADGKVNGTDIGLVISYILGKNPSDFNFDAADLDDSGNINGSDIGLIIKIILGK